MLDPVHDVKTDVGVLIINSILDINGPHTRISILLLSCSQAALCIGRTMLIVCCRGRRQRAVNWELEYVNKVTGAI